MDKEKRATTVNLGCLAFRPSISLLTKVRTWRSSNCRPKTEMQLLLHPRNAAQGGGSHLTRKAGRFEAFYAFTSLNLAAKGSLEIDVNP